MKNTLLSLLRDKNTSLESFRKAADQLGTALSFEAAGLLEQEENIIETPLKKTKGYKLKPNIVLIPILRAGISLLSPFMKLFSSSAVGFVGVKRNEITALPHLYYQNLPKINPDDVVIILDPMIATGGSGGVVVEMLQNLSLKEENIIYVGMVAAPEGIDALKVLAPKMRVICAEIDECLNDSKFIVPGLGDFGDRYFGT